MEELRHTIQSSRKNEAQEEELVLASKGTKLRIFQRPN
jgi:hypothetical protein